MSFSSLNYFKAKISAILKRYCCHSNGSCETFVKKSNLLDVVLYQYDSYFCFPTSNNCPKIRILNFPIFFKLIYRASLKCLKMK
jgi:hypothetical protein